MTQVDLRGCSFEGFVAFVFDHAPPAAAGMPQWYFDPELEVEFDGQLQLEHLTRLFRGADSLIESFTRAQIEQGLWFIAGPGGSEFFSELLWDARIAWDVRGGCIAAMVDLYDRLFRREPIGETAFMWWDLLCYEYRGGLRDPETDAEDARVQEAMLASLERILRLDSPECQRAALHGLYHLAHPRSLLAIREWLEEHPDAPADTRTLAERCLEGRMG